MTVVPQLFEGVELTDGEKGYGYKLAFDIQDIDGATSLINLLYLAATAPGVPQRHDPSGDVPGLFVIDRSIKAWPPKDAQVLVTFGVPSFISPPASGVLRVEGSAAVQEIQTERDRDGKPLLIDYKPEGGQWQGEQGGAVRQFVAYPQKRFTRTEDSSPEWELASLVGRLNRVEWRGDDPYTWMYSGCDFHSDDNEQTFVVIRSFVSDPYDLFAPILRWKDPQTGRPPAIKNPSQALMDKNGIAVADKQYFSFDFLQEFGF